MLPEKLVSANFIPIIKEQLPSENLNPREFSALLERKNSLNKSLSNLNKTSKRKKLKYHLMFQIKV